VDENIEMAEVDDEDGHKGCVGMAETEGSLSFHHPSESTLKEDKTELVKRLD
jgi:hypothetical protein